MKKVQKVRTALPWRERARRLKGRLLLQGVGSVLMADRVAAAALDRNVAALRIACACLAGDRKGNHA